MESKQSTQDNKYITRDVLVNRTAYIAENIVDSIVLEYTEIDSVTQLVNRIGYGKTFKKPDLINYKLLNCKTKAYIEYPDEKIRTPYLDTKTNEAVIRSFECLSPHTIPPPPPLYYYDGKLQYFNSLKDTLTGTTYYIFRGNDITFTSNMDGYFYFDSIFHLKKIYDEKDILLYSVN